MVPGASTRHRSGGAPAHCPRPFNRHTRHLQPLHQPPSYDERVNTVRVSIQHLSPNVQLPHYATDGSAGMDLPAAVSEPLTIPPGMFQLVPCGVAIALPHGFEAQVRPRSGLASKHGVTVLNAPGTIDCDYRGEVKVLLINHGADAFEVTPGMRIAQLVVAAVARVEWDQSEDLTQTARGAGGFGHTGQ